MAKRRQLKKNINYIIGELFAECIIISNDGKTDKAKTDELMGKILTVQDEFISRISHTEKGNEKAFYKKLCEDFNQQVDTIVDEISKLN